MSNILRKLIQIGDDRVRQIQQLEGMTQTAD